jgi:hypothetical protein
MYPTKSEPLTSSLACFRSSIVNGLRTAVSLVSTLAPFPPDVASLALLLSGFSFPLPEFFGFSACTFFPFSSFAFLSWGNKHHHQNMQCHVNVGVKRECTVLSSFYDRLHFYVVKQSSCLLFVNI